MSLQEKLPLLSKDLQDRIFQGERVYTENVATPVTNFLVKTKRHCNGGKTVDAWLRLRDHVKNGGKMFLTMAGAGSSFQQGILISELIRENMLHGISVTGANLEESLYRLVAHTDYAYIPDYVELTPQQEEELRKAGFRRITDTFLPEEESVRKILPAMETLRREAEANGESLLRHEYFFRLFERNMIEFDANANVDDCRLYRAWKHNIPVFVPGLEDSTMGNIFTHASYKGTHPLLSKYTLEDGSIDMHIVKPGIAYMHKMSERYLDNTQDSSIAFLQLGGGIAADFPICVVPHIKHDYLHEATDAEREKFVKSRAAFIEIHSSPMSFGSYSGAGWKEKITRDKFTPDAFGVQIFWDYTEHFPDIAAIMLWK